MQLVPLNEAAKLAAEGSPGKRSGTKWSGAPPWVRAEKISQARFRSLSEKSFSVISVPPWCILFLGISTRRHGEHGVYTEKCDYSDRLLANACSGISCKCEGGTERRGGRPQGGDAVVAPGVNAAALHHPHLVVCGLELRLTSWNGVRTC